MSFIVPAQADLARNAILALIPFTLNARIDSKMPCAEKPGEGKGLVDDVLDYVSHHSHNKGPVNYAKIEEPQRTATCGQAAV
jgi:hypothetical protein